MDRLDARPAGALGGGFAACSKNRPLLRGAQVDGPEKGMKRPDLPANGPDLDDTGSGQWSGAFEPPKTESSVSLEDSETKIKSETTKALEMPTGREEEPLPGLCVSMDVEGVEKREGFCMNMGWDVF